MNWTSLVGPAVVAAVISGLVSTIGIWISARTARRIHTEKLAFDQGQAERRFVQEVGVTEAKIKADIALAERRMEAEIALAKKRLELDRALVAWKRKADVAEEILAEFYKARDVISGARSPLVFQGEGEKREPRPRETDADKRSLDAHYVVIERLRHHDDFFVQLYARSYRSVALFGAAARQPYEELSRIQREIAVAANMLLDTYENRNEGSLPLDRIEWRKTVSWWGEQDPIAARLDQIVQAVEAMCRAVIEEGAP